MFTRDCLLDNRQGAVFQPNHFCPLFQSGNSNGIAFHGSGASFQTSSFVPDAQSTKEFPPLGSKNKDKKNDIRSFFKYPKKKTARKNTFSQTNDKIHGKDENDSVSTGTSMSNFKTLSFSKECVDGKSPSIECFDTLPELSTKYLSQLWYHRQGVVKTRNAGISRNMAEYHGICRNITIFSDGSHATVYKHGRLTTYFITKVMDLSHFHQTFSPFSRVFTKNFESI
jgi:hypothetical protein